MINETIVRENTELFNKLSLLKDEKLRSRFINNLLIDVNNSEIKLSCKYTNGNEVLLTPSLENNDFDIDLLRLQKELISYTKEFIKREAEEKIELIKEKLIGNVLTIQ